MAAQVTNTSKKIVLDLTEGTQTISPILESASDESVYNTGVAIGTLQKETLDIVKLVITETITA